MPSVRRSSFRIVVDEAEGRFDGFSVASFTGRAGVLVSVPAKGGRGLFCLGIRGRVVGANTAAFAGWAATADGDEFAALADDEVPLTDGSPKRDPLGLADGLDGPEGAGEGAVRPPVSKGPVAFFKSPRIDRLGSATFTLGFSLGISAARSAPLRDFTLFLGSSPR